MSDIPAGEPGGDPAQTATQVFTGHRELLFSVVYNMLGSVADTEDVLQETWLAWVARTQAASGEQITSPRAYLVRIAVNRALARQASIRRRREDYTGPWLPEPLITEDQAGDSAETATDREPKRLCRRGDISFWSPRISTRGDNRDHATLVVESKMRRVMTIGSGAALVSVLSVLIAGCGGSPEAHAAHGTTMTTAVGSVTAATAVTAVRSHSVPVSVESDAAMRAAGNQGPSPSILVPSSCKVTARSATATGTYRDGFAAEVYARYGDVIDLYVFSRPTAGYPEGIQLANEPFSRHSPFIRGKGPWTVTVPLDSTLGQPARCMVAAQPTMDFQGAP